jgi:hypothetical protein
LITMTYQPPPAYGPGGQPWPGMPPGSPQPMPIGPRRYSLFAAPFRFWSPAFWRDIGQRGRGIGFWYMFFLLLITWGIVFGKWYPAFKEFINTEAPKVISQVPAITIKNGVVSTDPPGRHEIRNPDNNQLFAVIDTEDETNTPPPERPSVLLTRDALITRDAQDAVKITPLKEVKDFHLDQSDLYQIADKGRAYFWVAFAPVVVVGSFIGRLVLMLVFGLIGLGFASGTGAKVGFGGLMRLAAIAMTPIIVIDTVLMVTPIPPLGCGWTLIAIAMELILLFLAVRANAPDASAPPPGGYMPAAAWGGAPYPAQGYPQVPGYPPPPQAGGYPQAPGGYPPPPGQPGGYPPPGGYAPPPPGGYAPPPPTQPPPPPPPQA